MSQFVGGPRGTVFGMALCVVLMARGAGVAVVDDSMAVVLVLEGLMPMKNENGGPAEAVCNSPTRMHKVFLQLRVLSSEPYTPVGRGFPSLLTAGSTRCVRRPPVYRVAARRVESSSNVLPTRLPGVPRGAGHGVIQGT